MTQPQLIGLTGPAGCGKDTAAAIIEGISGLYYKVAFADPLRNGLRAMFGLSDTQMERPEKEQVLHAIGKSPRQLMQTLGTEWGRNLVHPELWTILALATIRSHRDKGQRVVITDVRFENEAALVREMGGVVWHIHRDSAGTPHAHASESGVIRHGSDVAINNNGTLPDYIAAIKKALH